MTKSLRKILSYSVIFSLTLQLVGAPMIGVLAASSDQIAEWFAREKQASTSIEALSPEIEELQNKLEAINKTKTNLQEVASNATAKLGSNITDLLSGPLRSASLFMLTEKAGGYADYITKYGVFSDVEMDIEQYGTWLDDNKTKLEDVNKRIESINQTIKTDNNTINRLSRELAAETDEGKRASIQNRIDAAQAQLKIRLKNHEDRIEERKIYLLTYSIPNHILHIKEIDEINENIGAIADGLNKNQIDDEWISALQTAGLNTNLSNFLEDGIKITDLASEEDIRQLLVDKETESFEANKELKQVEREKLEDIFVYADDSEIGEQYKIASKTAIESLNEITELKDKHTNIVQTNKNIEDATSRVLISLEDAKQTIIEKAPLFASLFMLEEAGGFKEYIDSGVFDGVDISPDKYKQLLTKNTTKYESLKLRIENLEEEIEKLQDKNGLTEQEQKTLADNKDKLTELQTELEELYGLNYAIPHDILYTEILDEMDEWSEYIVAHDIKDAEWIERVEKVLGSTSKYNLANLFINKNQKIRKFDIDKLFEGDTKRDDLDTEDDIALELDEAKVDAQESLNTISEILPRQASATLLPTFDFGGEIFGELVDGFIKVEITTSKPTLFTPVDPNNINDSKTILTARVIDIDGEPVIGARVSFNSGNAYFPDNSGGFSNTATQLTVGNEDINQSGIVEVDYAVSDDDKIAGQYKRDVIDIYAVATVELENGKFSQPVFAHLELIKENKNLVIRDPSVREEEIEKDKEAEEESDKLLLEARSNPGNLLVNMTAEMNPEDNLDGDTEATVTVRVQAAFAKQATGIRDEKTGQPVYTDEQGRNINFNAPQTLRPELIFSGMASDEEDTSFNIQFPLTEKMDRWNLSESEERDVDDTEGLVEKTVAWAINNKIKKKINLNTAISGVRDIDILVELVATSLGLDEEIKSIIRDEIENDETTTQEVNNQFILANEVLTFRQDNPAPDQEVDITFEANPSQVDEGQAKIQLTGELTGTIWEIVRDPSNGMPIKQPGRTQKLSGTAELSITSSDNETGFLDKDIIEIPENGKFKVDYYTPEAQGERTITISISGKAFDADNKNIGDFATSLTIEHGTAPIDESVGDSRVLLGENSDGNRTLKIYGSRNNVTQGANIQPYRIKTFEALGGVTREFGNNIRDLITPTNQLKPEYLQYQEAKITWEQSKPLHAEYTSTRQFNQDFESWKNNQPEPESFGTTEISHYAQITTEITDLQGNIITTGNVRGSATDNRIRARNQNPRNILAAEGVNDGRFYSPGWSGGIINLDAKIDPGTGETYFYFVPGHMNIGEIGKIGFSYSYSGQGRLGTLSVDVELPVVSNEDASNSSKPTITINKDKKPLYLESGKSEIDKCGELFDPRNPIESNREVEACIKEIRLKELEKIRLGMDQTNEEIEYEHYYDQAYGLRISVKPGKNGSSSAGKQIRIVSEPPAIFIPAPSEQPEPGLNPIGDPGEDSPIPIPQPLPGSYKTSVELQLTKPGEITMALDGNGEIGAEEGRELLVLPNGLPTKITVHYQDETGTYWQWETLGYKPITAKEKPSGADPKPINREPLISHSNTVKLTLKSDKDLLAPGEKADLKFSIDILDNVELPQAGKTIMVLLPVKDYGTTAKASFLGNEVKLIKPKTGSGSWFSRFIKLIPGSHQYPDNQRYNIKYQPGEDASDAASLIIGSERHYEGTITITKGQDELDTIAVGIFFKDEARSQLGKTPAELKAITNIKSVPWTKLVLTAKFGLLGSDKNPIQGERNTFEDGEEPEPEPEPSDPEPEPEPDPSEPEPDPDPSEPGEPEPDPGDTDSFEFNPDQPTSFDLDNTIGETNSVIGDNSYISDRDRERYNGYINDGDYNRAGGVIYGKVRSDIPDEFKSNPEVRELADSAVNLIWSQKLNDVLNDSKFSENEKRYIEQALTQFLENGNLAALDAIANIERYGIDDWPEQIRRDYKAMGFDIDTDGPQGGQFDSLAPDFYGTISQARQTINGSTILGNAAKFTINGTIGLDIIKQYPAQTLSSAYHNIKSHIDSATENLDSTHSEVVELYQMLNNILLDNFLIETLEQNLNDSQKQQAATWISQIKQGQVSAIDNFSEFSYWDARSKSKKLDNIKNNVIYNRNRMGLSSDAGSSGDEVPLFGDLSGNLDNLFNIFGASAGTDSTLNPVVNVWNSAINFLGKLFNRN